MPEFSGGPNKLFDYMGKNIKYPKDAIDNKIGGTIIVGFIIGETGEITNHELVLGIYPSLNTEAIKLIKNMPPWKPGKIKGKNVKVKYELPVRFRIR